MKPTILEVQAMLDKHFLQPQFCINYSTNRENSSLLETLLELRHQN
jgi:hypothetical protein